MSATLTRTSGESPRRPLASTPRLAGSNRGAVEARAGADRGAHERGRGSVHPRRTRRRGRGRRPDDAAASPVVAEHAPLHALTAGEARYVLTLGSVGRAEEAGTSSAGAAVAPVAAAWRASFWRLLEGLARAPEPAATVGALDDLRVGQKVDPEAPVAPWARASRGSAGTRWRGARRRRPCSASSRSGVARGERVQGGLEAIRRRR